MVRLPNGRPLLLPSICHPSARGPRSVTPQTKRYKNAPIVEAVIDIQVQPPESRDDPDLKGLAESLKAEFPKQDAMHQVEMGIGPIKLEQQEEAPAPVISTSPVGFRLTKSDNSRIFQIRRNGVTYSHLPKYTEWAIFRAEAKDLWQRYRALRPAAKLKRCALRYINRFDLPGTKIEIEDYFYLYPQIPAQLPQQDITGMTFSLHMPQHDMECVAILNQAQIEPVKPDHLSIVLDVDIFRLGIEDWDDARLWAFLDMLRVRKNEIFESSITDRTRELIDE